MIRNRLGIETSFEPFFFMFKRDNMKNRLQNYYKKLSKMSPESTQYLDQHKRIENFERTGSIALLEKKKKG